MSNIPWSLTPAGGTPWLIDDGLGQAGMYSRGILDHVLDLDKRQIISYVIAHNPGERRTNSRDVAKLITFSGHVWGNPDQSEARLIANWDTLLRQFDAGVQQLCVQPDGRYWNAELLEAHPKVVAGDPWHVEYSASFIATDPYAYGAATATTVISGQTMANVSGTLYAYSWTAGTAGQLGSAPSPLTVTVTLVTANGAFFVQLVNTSTSPNQATAMVKAPFLDGDVLTFDSPNAQGTITTGASRVKSTLPVFPITLDAAVGAPTSLTLNVRATSAPVITIAASFAARFR